MRRLGMWKVLVVLLSVSFLVTGCSDTKKKPCDKNSVLACLYASGLNAVRGSVPVSVDVDGDGVVDGTLLSSKNDGILDVIDLNNDGVGDVRFIDSTGEGKGNIDGLDIDNDGFIDIYKTVSGNTTTLSTKKGGTGTTVSFLDTNADGKKDGFDLTKDSVSDTFFTLKGIDLNGDGKADAGLLDTNGDGVIDSIDLDGDLVADVSYIDTNADGVADAFDLNGDGTADIFYNSGKTPLLSTVKDGGGRTVLAVDKNRDGKYEGFDLDGDGAGEYAVTAIDFNGDGIFDGTLIDTNMDGKSDSIDINGDNIGDIAFLDTDNNGIPEGLDTNLDGTVEVYFSKSATQKLSTLINGGGSAVKTIDSNGDGSPDGFDTNGDGTIDVTIHTKGVPFKVGDKIDLDADGKVDGTLVDKDSDGKVDGIDVNGDGRRDIVYSDANGDGKYDSLDSDGDGVIDVSHKPGQAPVLSNLKNGGSATSDGDKRVVTSSVTASIVGFSTIDDQSYSVVAPVAISSNDAAPQGLKYDPSSLSLVKGTAMTEVVPTVSSGTVSSYSVSPTLPSGVSLNTTTGAISGTPSAVQQAANYTVTASNAGGTTTSVVSIGVDSTETPTGFSYSSSSVDATVGTAITPLLPTIAGTIDYCIVSPKLPAGLKLNRTTCEISGTPTVAQNTASYTVTAKGPGGDLTTIVSIKVNSVPLVQTGTGTSTGTGTGTGSGTSTGTGTGTSTGTAVSAPTSITYTGSPFTYTKGTAITTITPTLAPSGVTLTSCTISPILPAGLSINATTCAISGTPTEVKAGTSYTVTATNSAGSAFTSIYILVKEPATLTYAGSPYTYYNGVAITTVTPTKAPTTFTISNCTISPALPTGLALNTTTCAISGTPSVASASTEYTISTTSSEGSITTKISIAVNTPNPPTSITYTGSPFVFQRAAITPLTPTLQPSDVVLASCTVSPPLVSGLTINQSNCVISGTPSDGSGSTTYTVTAANIAGSVSTTIKIGVELFAGCGSDPVYTYPLLKTGATTSYSTGDDFNANKGTARSYTDNNDGTITESVTGLIWQKCAKGRNIDATCSDNGSTTDDLSLWSDAKTYCSSLTLAGKTWRLPADPEYDTLRNIIGFDTNFFPGSSIQADPSYWTSSCYRNDTRYGWGISPEGVFVSGSGYNRQDIIGIKLRVRCVSGGNGVERSFTKNSEGTIKDNKTGLIWHACISPNSWNSTTSSCAGTSAVGSTMGSATAINPVTWQQAVTACNSLTFASKTWRLPNVNELKSIVDVNLASGIDNNYFQTNPQGYNWTSTRDNRGYAWAVYLNEGTTNFQANTSTGYYRCVSGP